MPPNITAGSFKIVSLIEGEPPTGVGYTRQASQEVFLDGPVTNWQVQNTEGKDFWHLSLGNYANTGLVGDMVTATINTDNNVEWIASYKELQDAYTISPVDNQFHGWTAPTDPGDRAFVEIKPIIEFKSFPPKYLHSQLFKFVPINGE